MTRIEPNREIVVALTMVLERLFATRFFLCALLIHLGILALLGLWMVGPPMLFQKPFDPVTTHWVDPPPVRPPPQKIPETSPHPSDALGDGLEGKVFGPPSLPTRDTVISTDRKSDNPFAFNNLQPIVHERLCIPGSGTGVTTTEGDRIRGEKIGKFAKSWFDDPTKGPLGSYSGSKIPKCTFTCYLGKYADGDWYCNPTALENMLGQVVRWSKDRIKASVQPEAIDLASDEIYQTHPPFIFLTGHRDFHFTEAEATNLREYLTYGGALWVDNSMPGRHSRFDTAFRREMKRVLPDREFEPVPRNHPIFNSFYYIKQVPRGMNFYAEPIEQIRIQGDLVVLYTQNAYSDLWETALNEQNKIDTDLYLDEDTGRYYTKWGPHWGNAWTGFLYRNVTEESIVESNELALNIVVHLLTRYQDKVMTIGAK